MNKKVIIVGVGSGNINHLTQESIDIIRNSQEIYAFKRVKSLLNNLNEKIIEVALKDVILLVNDSKNNEVVILLSGDINFYSATKYLKSKLDSEIVLIPGLSSFQILCARVNLSYENMKLISLHGKNKRYLGNIMSNEHTFILCDFDNDISKILNDLKHLSHLKFYIGENLGMSNEEITIGYFDEINQKTFSDLSVIIIENNLFVDIDKTLYDSDFIRDEVPMTKQEIRWLILSLLDLKKTDILYDIGSGSGSVSIACAYKLNDGHVYSIERKESAFNLTNENINKLHAYNISTYLSKASKVISELEIPDKVFIGGSSSELEKIVDIVIDKSKKVTFVITCITLETQNKAVQIFNDKNIEYDVYAISSARSKKVGTYHMMYANNPITIIKGVYSHE